MTESLPWRARVIVAVGIATACACVSARNARAAALPNELPTPDIAVDARAASGPFFRPGAWTALRAWVENSGDAFTASVRVRETRGGTETHFVVAERAEIAPGRSAFDAFITPGDPSAGTTLEIVRLQGGAGEVVFRSALSRILRPLARGERLIVTVGEMPVPLRGDERMRVWALAPRELPAEPEAYSSVNALVIGGAARSAVSPAQARAAVRYALGGGRIVFMSLRALEAFWQAISATRTETPDSIAELRAAFPASRVRAGTDTDPRAIEFPLGLGRCAVLPGKPDGKLAAEFAAELAKLAELLGRPRTGMFVDAAAFGALDVDRPFARGAMRARTVAIVGALIVTVCVALIAKKRVRVAGGVIGAAAVAWTAIALVTWREPVAAARVVRVRALSADGRAEAVADTAMLIAFGRRATLAFETDTAPPLPVARRPGQAFAEPFVLRGRESAWRISSLSVYPEEPFIVRATSAREAGPDAEALRKRVLAEGARVKVTTLPGGGRKLSADTDLPRDVRYLLERFAPPCSETHELAWVWVEGSPEGARAPGCDTAPGSGTLVIVGVPLAGESD